MRKDLEGMVWKDGRYRKTGERFPYKQVVIEVNNVKMAISDSRHKREATVKDAKMPILAY